MSFDKYMSIKKLLYSIVFNRCLLLKKITNYFTKLDHSDIKLDSLHVNHLLFTNKIYIPNSSYGKED